MLGFSDPETLEEASKSILLNTRIVSVVNTVVRAASSKGPALFDHDEGTSGGGTLISILLLNYFALRSLHAILPGVVDWRDFLITTDPTESLTFISIPCHDLCRLLHFGSPVVKLVASYSLLELFARISDQVNSEHEELKCSIGYLMSIKSVLEGLVFYNDLRVATNCCICLSMVLGWEKQINETNILGKSTWLRFIVEEVTLSLAAPCLTSQSFTNNQRPAIHVAIALLKMHNFPGWMRSVFNDSCIYGILENLATSNLSTEILVLFGELLKSDFLNSEQIATMNQVLQACRKRMYTDNDQDGLQNGSVNKVLTASDDVGEVSGYLIHLMSSLTYLDLDSRGFHLSNRKLLEEMELFFKTLTVDDNRR